MYIALIVHMENSRSLFAPDQIASRNIPTESGKPRIIEPQRKQSEIRFEVPEDALPPSHTARVLWNLLGTLDLNAFSAGCGSIEGNAGRSMLSPRMLMTLWLYAISQAVGSAREIERLIGSDVAYRWIAGDLRVSHHKLSGFRVGHGAALNTLMTDILAALMNKGLLSLDVVAQDGTRTRAAASAPSFRTYGSLLECREQAALHLKAVLASANDPEYTRAQHAARANGARKFQERVEAAIATVVELQKKALPKADPARASTTDAEARRMKTGEGGYRPGYNFQYAVAGSPLGGPRTIVGIQVTNLGTDMGSLEPMAEQIEERTGKHPGVLLADAGHAKHSDIAATRKRGIDVLVSVPSNARSIERLRQDGADPEVIAWRERMETTEAKRIYRARAGLAELSNAHQKTHHGLAQVLVRGIEKVTCVVLLNAIGSNLLQNARYLLG